MEPKRKLNKRILFSSFFLVLLVVSFSVNPSQKAGATSSLTLRPNAVGTYQQFALFGVGTLALTSDNFDDNSIDAKWLKVQQVTATVAETGGQVACTSTVDGVSGYVSASSYNSIDTSIQIDYNSGTMYAQAFGIGLTQITSDNPYFEASWYRIYVATDETFLVQRSVNTVVTTQYTGVTGGPTYPGTGTLKIIISGSTISFYYGTSLLFSEPYALSSYTVYVYLYGAQYAAAVCYFDAFVNNLAVGTHDGATSDQSDATGVQVTASTALKETENLADHTSETGTINSITAYMKAKSVTSISYTALLTDGFEGSGAAWDDFWDGNGATDWTQSSTQKHGGSYSALAGSTSNDLLSDGLDMSTAVSIQVTFWYLTGGTLESSDAILQFYDGAGLDSIVDFSTLTQGSWTQYTTTTTDSQYFDNGFYIKFEGTSIDSGETLYIDDVVISRGVLSNDEQAKLLWRLGTTEVLSSAKTISTSAFTEYSDNRATDPDGNTWTWTHIDALELGSQASTLGVGETISFSEYWIVVDYTTSTAYTAALSKTLSTSKAVSVLDSFHVAVSKVLTTTKVIVVLTTFNVPVSKALATTRAVDIVSAFNVALSKVLTMVESLNVLSAFIVALAQSTTFLSSVLGVTIYIVGLSQALTTSNIVDVLTSFNVILSQSLIVPNIISAISTFSVSMSKALSCISTIQMATPIIVALSQILDFFVQTIPVGFIRQNSIVAGALVFMFLLAFVTMTLFLVMRRRR